MSGLDDTNAPPTEPAAPAPAAPAQPTSTTAQAIAAARQRIAGGGSLVEPASEGAKPAAPPEETPPSNLTVTLPGMEERGEKPLELEAPDQETYERLNRLQNEATIGREVKQEQRGVADLRRQRAEVEDKIAGDPAGFVLEKVPEHVRAEIAMQLFFAPGVVEAIQERLGQGEDGRSLVDMLESPDALRTLRAELKASRLEMRDRLRQSTEQRRTMEANAEKVIGEIERLIPPTVTGERRERLFADAVRDVRDRARRLGLTEIDPRDLRLILAPRLGREAVELYRGTGARPAPSPTGALPRKSAPLAPGVTLPKTTAARIKLAKEIGLEALLDRARGTTT